MNLIFNIYCTIRRDHVWINDRETFKAIPASEKDFLKQLYQHLQLDYPKFYKMDHLSKLGLLGVELLRNEYPEMSQLADDAIALVFQTESGCLESDIAHQENINQRAASPAVFVYTLSNIVIGEISIRNKWFGESVCFIGNRADLNDLISYSKSLILNHKAQLVIAGLVDSVNDEHVLNLFVVEQGIAGTKFNEENVKKIIELK